MPKPVLYILIFFVLMAFVRYLFRKDILAGLKKLGDRSSIQQHR